jgi:hypothetical protein
MGNYGIIHLRIGIDPVQCNPENIPAVLMELIIGEFIPDEEQDDENTGQSAGQADDIDGGKKAVAVDIPQGYQQEAPEHVSPRYSLCTIYEKQ